MTTKEYLNQISRLNRMINNKLSELAELKELSKSISAVSNKERVQTSMEQDKIGNTISKIDEMEREIDKMIDSYSDKRKHIIGQRTCRRNTLETQYVMLKIWDELYKLDPVFFAPDTTGPFCQRGTCKEGKMSCGRPIDKTMTPTEIHHADFPLLYETE